MNQKLSDWASIAEIVSGIAVVVTLIFLLIGIRENTEIARASAYERNIDSLNEWRMLLLSDDELRRSWETYLDGRYDDLTPDEQSRVSWAQGMLWYIYEKAFFANQYGTLGPSEWARTEGMLCLMSETMPKSNRASLMERSTEEFVEHIMDACPSSQ